MKIKKCIYTNNIKYKIITIESRKKNISIIMGHNFKTVRTIKALSRHLPLVKIDREGKVKDAEVTRI